MKNLIRWYHTVTGQWVEILFEFDEKCYLVKYPNDESTNSFLAKKNDLVNYVEYFKLLLRGDIYNNIDHTVINYFKKHENFNVDQACNDLQIPRPYLLKIFDSLMKRGFVNYVYDDNTKQICGNLLKRAEKKHINVLLPKINKIWLLFLVVVTLNVLGINQHNINCYENNKIEIERLTYKDMVIKRMNYIENQEFKYDLFVEYLRYVGVRNINVVKSQALLETGFFTSQIFFENNNLFGMKKPFVRNNLVVGVNRGHATFNHWTDSVKDYKLWYNFMTRNNNYNNYYNFLAAMGYAEDGTYIQKLKQIEERIINNNIYLAYENNY